MAETLTPGRYHPDPAIDAEVRLDVLAAERADLQAAVKPILKKTPEYEQARAEGRSRAWLDAEALSLGHALTGVVSQRLEHLDPDAGR